MTKTDILNQIHLKKKLKDEAINKGDEALVRVYDDMIKSLELLIGIKSPDPQKNHIGNIMRKAKTHHNEDMHIYNRGNKKSDERKEKREEGLS